jgi:hypothetical protein
LTRVCGIATALAFGAWCTSASAEPADQKKQAAKPRVRVTISKETTVITEPLRDDGYPDYIRYLNDKLSQGVTPENNADVALLRVFGPFDVEEAIQPQFFQGLGVDPLPSKGAYCQKWSHYVMKVPESEYPPVPLGDDRKPKEYFEKLAEIAGSRPWKAGDYPHVAKWLEANEKYFAALIAASKRPRSFSPLFDNSPRPALVRTLLPGVELTRAAVEALRARAMLRAGENRIHEALDDLLACRRFARLAVQQGTLTNILVGYGIEQETQDAEIAILSTSRVESRDIESHRKRVLELPPLPGVADSIDVFDRFTCLDAVCWVAQAGSHKLRYLARLVTSYSSSGDEEPPQEADVPWQLLDYYNTYMVDWHWPLRAANEWYDELVRIYRIKDMSVRAKSVEQYARAFKEETARYRRPDPLSDLLHTRRSFASAQTSRVVLGLFFPMVEGTFRAEARNVTRRGMFEVALALELYRNTHRKYPERLRDLVPELLGEIPHDAFTGRELEYKSTERGYVLYSFGANGNDDQGLGYDDREDADDIAIRVPAE